MIILTITLLAGILVLIPFVLYLDHIHDRQKAEIRKLESQAGTKSPLPDDIILDILFHHIVNENRTSYWQAAQEKEQKSAKFLDSETIQSFFKNPKPGVNPFQEWYDASSPEEKAWWRRTTSGPTLFPSYGKSDIDFDSDKEKKD